MVELVIVLWIIWLERNKLCFQDCSIPTLQSVGARIAAWASFWCKTLGNNLFLKLSLLMPLDTTNLPCQDLLELEEEDLEESEAEFKLWEVSKTHLSGTGLPPD